MKHIFSLVPRLLPVFKSFTQKNAREHGKIRHVHEIRWKGLCALCTLFTTLYAKGHLDTLAILACTSMSIQVCLPSCLSIILLPVNVCTLSAKSLPPDIKHMMNFTRFPHFSACKTGEAWVWGYRIFFHSRTNSLLGRQALPKHSSWWDIIHSFTKT